MNSIKTTINTNTRYIEYANITEKRYKQLTSIKKMKETVQTVYEYDKAKQINYVNSMRTLLHNTQIIIKCKNKNTRKTVCRYYI